MLEFVNKYAGNIKYSQNGEEKIALECLRRMKIEKGHCVEAGGADGHFCSNTALLLERGFSGLFVEADWNLYQQCKSNWAHNPHVRVQCCYVDEQNINAFVDDKCDVLSLDTDGSDYKIFQGLRAKPKIVIVEIDSSIPPYLIEFNAEGGAGYAPMVILAGKKGYFLLCHTGNLILIRNDFRSLFPDITADPLSETDLYFKRDWLRAA